MGGWQAWLSGLSGPPNGDTVVCPTQCSSPSNTIPSFAAVSALRERPPAYATAMHPRNEIGGHVNMKVRTSS